MSTDILTRRIAILMAKQCQKESYDFCPLNQDPKVPSSWNCPFTGVDTCFAITEEHWKRWLSGKDEIGSTPEKE